jgi:hypothetical protein
MKNKIPKLPDGLCVSYNKEKKQPKLKIQIFYRHHWYPASSIMLDREGNISVEYCHDNFGCIGSEHIEDIKVEVVE